MISVELLGEFGVDITTKSIRSQLAAAKNQPITCRFFSEGGSVFEGFAIANAFREYRGSKTAVVDAAFSIASYVLAVGGFGKIQMSENGWLMLHNPYSENDETSPSEIKLLSSLGSQLAQAYATRARKPIATIQALMEQETFLNSTEAVKWGFADSITANGQSMAIAARLRDKVLAKLVVGKTSLEQWKALVRIHGHSKADKINPELRQRVIREAN